MSRQTLETRLVELEHNKSELLNTTSVSPKLTYSADVPRSQWERLPRFETVSMTATGESPTSSHSILPKSGESVLPFKGRAHPIVEPLLVHEGTLKSAYTLPIVQLPPKTLVGKSVSGPPVDQIASPTAPGYSYILLLCSFIYSLETPPAQLVFEPPTRLRSVLFIYPPDIDVHSVIACYQEASKAVLHPMDKLTILWAMGEHKVEPYAYEAAHSFIAGQESVIKVSTDNFAEVSLIFSYYFRLSIWYVKAPRSCIN